MNSTRPATLFADALARYEGLFQEDRTVLVSGLVRDRGSEIELTVEEMEPLERAAAGLLREVELTLADGLSRREMLRLRDVLIEHRGKTPVSFCVELPRRRLRIEPPANYTVRFDEAFQRSVEEVLGAGRVQAHYAVASEVEALVQ